MLTKRLNIMLYCEKSGEQIILPINPKSIDIKYEKNVEKFNILGFGEINMMGYKKPIKIKLSHFLPEDNSVFGTNSNIMLEAIDANSFIEQDYSSTKAVEILKKWAIEQNTIRLVIDDELNMEGIVTSFVETIRESTASKPYVLEILEYRNPIVTTKGSFGLIKRAFNLVVPKILVMKSKDTVYSLADKYKLDFKALAKNNNIKDANSSNEGKKLTTIGA